jgi:hypothetical protein
MVRPQDIHTPPKTDLEKYLAETLESVQGYLTKRVLTMTEFNDLCEKVTQAVRRVTIYPRG